MPMLLAQSVTNGTEAATTGPQTLIDYIVAGGLLSYVLVALSAVALGLMVRNVIVLRAERLAPFDLIERLQGLLDKGDLAGAAAFCRLPENDCPLTRVFGAALERCAHSPFALLEMRSALEDAGQIEVDRLHRLNDGLGIIAAIGPMLGLLGTVIGMIGAFGAISSLQGAARSNELARFMSLALVNTAEGLIVAIPCTIAFALFRRRIARLAGDFAELIEELAGRAGSPAAPGGKPHGARAEPARSPTGPGAA